MLDLLPAVDIVAGQAVRLHQGKAGSEKIYGVPLEAARTFEAAGARWLHLVDLDAAFGRGNNTQVVQEIVEQVDLQVEVSGGIRDDESLARVLQAGARRVNLGTAAIEKPEWTCQVIAEYGEQIAVGLDVRGHTVATHGWTKDAGNLFEMITQLDAAGCVRYVVTDVMRDGTLTGPNTQLLREVCEATSAKVVASGGVSTLDDLRALRELNSIGVEGVIVGKALYSGQFTIEQALAVANGRA
ncbi:bifunctional 1-(5-phosphoribosyl)-5-((5-phosphoribosylamino)methylideneamino)imidazole-4-carboxamide isomerase/phosphoribosylanthranilate isomerase PriA [Varibaculum vaginae]|uniref:bifunctional 1-(5-phosphoribosyl)-5-((5- phosphoribosylamino)methylideneamino)imidazole-4- carboxamide isomerase/phosphoribosylanthranilate isomerase PriA n=1 Tax=Varibaculum vaginae TaxID=2364797 RepID=UPI000F078653|nr:bifunctional 1-(5-phosphoribosyl)-5-((5-phosphoribosylamino)methylideneamino)imidazole-4-carboxamide isomerase/phosphoribosylanthranilate isomerase PriA [Varibaculum vaginae]